ncbi:MAG: DUF3943 domain-containing protein [Marinospirillum sp.]|uniref:DUF3943 domain-containing protein n=1 Tax=Marinospirillum sp. TaxID=2183934 RepID=UPI0019E2278E|nr:DUF3943 domain-containing protein [Marinospirillum sp.]MBE0505722.1 DUF3943 domain-containing protein [Marinospirillum sp.]
MLTRRYFLLSLFFCCFPVWSQIQSEPTLPYNSLAYSYLANIQPSMDMKLAANPLADQSQPPKYQGMVRETRNIGIMSLGIMAIIYALPESISKWDRSEMTFSKLGDNWVQNNKDGPVWDQDEWQLNYIGHPYFGAVYYMVARNQGLTPLESGGYSFLMSTFLWEMGIEALAEIPSKQDIIVTPLIGSIVGEAFYTWEQRIQANNSKLLGSRFLGKSTLVFLNPAGSLSARINRALGDDKPTSGAYSQLIYSPAYQRFEPGVGYSAEPEWIGIKLGFQF